MKDIKAVLKIFQTGAITITAPSVSNVQAAVERIYPLVYEFKKPKPLSAEHKFGKKRGVFSLFLNLFLFRDIY